MSNQQQQPAQNQRIAVIQDTRLPYHPALAELNCDRAMWRFLVDSLYPAAKTIEGVAMALRYCQARKLDIMKKPVHVVPVYSTVLKKTVEMVWPGIGDYRTTAARTTEYAGCDETECGPLRKEVFEGDIDVWENNNKTGTKHITAEIEYCEWMRVTVYRIVKGQKVKFVGPRVYFKETYSSIKFGCHVPNDRWQRAPNGQLEKCAEAAALRKAFPEEIGADPTAEEMEGKSLDVVPTALREPTAAELDQMVNEKMAATAGTSTAAQTQQGQAAEPAQPEQKEPSDWDSVFDEILPGLEACESPAHVKAFVDENQPIMESFSKAPRDIQLRWTEAFTKKMNSFKKN